jgi:sugar phosphate isomerase/epimerase
MKFRLIVLCFGLIAALSAAEKKTPFLVCSAYTFRQDSLLGAIERAASLGVKHIETFTNLPLSADDQTRVYELNDAQIARLQAHLEKHGVSVISCMGGVPKDEKKARAFFDAATRLGARYIGTDSVDAIDTIEKIIGDYDLTVAFHNHPTNPSKPEYRNSDPHYMLALLAGRHERIGVYADTGHYATSGVVPMEALRLLGDRVKALHLKDRAAIGERTPDLVYGQGALDVAGMIRDLVTREFSGLLVMEYEVNSPNKFEEVRQCAEFVQAELAKR